MILAKIWLKTSDFWHFLKYLHTEKGEENICHSQAWWQCHLGSKHLVFISPPLKMCTIRPGWCGSVDWVPACEPTGHLFSFQSGHTPGQLWARSPVGGTWKATTHWCFSPSFSLPSPLSKNKYNLSNKVK